MRRCAGETVDLVSAADDLHERIFGFRPKKAGTAYERLAAVVLAGQGWKDVKHQTKLQLEERRAVQRLDVTATHPDGSIQRLVVECKDWDETVGKGTMDALVGVRSQAGFDAAMAVTTKGFTSGAVDVAVDENIAMVVLREYEPEADNFVLRVEIRFQFSAPPERSPVQVVVADDFLPAPDATEALSRLDVDTQLRNLDGSPAETIEELLTANGAVAEGTFDCEADLGEGRLLGIAGAEVRVKKLKWSETVHPPSEETSVIEKPGEPCLVIEQLDESGRLRDRKLVVDRDLNAWDIVEDGTVSESRGLA
jgi:hypothetical protein